MAAATDHEGNGWARAFGGVGNALGCRLELPGFGELRATPDELPEVAGSAFLEVMVLDETGPGAAAPLHAVVGERLRSTEVMVGAGARAGPWPLRLNRGRFVTAVETGERSFDRVVVETYRRVPDWADDPVFHTLVTIVFRLRGGEPSPSVEPGGDEGLAIVGPCDHLGLVLLDRQSTRAHLEREGLDDVEDLISVLGGTPIGEELVAEGGLIPLWGMRPWLYRLVVPGRRPSWLPLGQRVAPPAGAPRLPSPRALTVAPGRTLLDLEDFEARTWPELRFHDERARSLRLELWSLTGFEPIDPTAAVTILPTFLLYESPEEPPPEPSPPFGGIDPFEPLPPASPWSASVRLPSSR